MKVLFIVLIWLTSITVVKGQIKSSDKIYWTALDKYTVALDSMYKKYPKEKPDTIFLQKAGFIDSIPSKINGYHIILITQGNQRKLYRDHDNSLVHTIIFPLALEDTILHITITPYGGVLKRNHYNLGVSGGATIYFKFDCEKQQFVFIKTKEWGI